MPKGHRSVRSQGFYRQSPVTTPTTAQYAPLPLNTRTANLPNTYYQSSPIDPMAQAAAYTSQTQSVYSTGSGGPVQHPLSNTTYSIPQCTTSSTAPPLASIRPSSGAWTPTDDQTLMAARAQGMNWSPIQQAYFPTKTPNACRKRHERLMEKRSADDWDGMKLETLAKSYMGMRKEIWQGLAEATGEKWSVVEQKCMSQGLKNLQTSARSCARRERLDPSASLSHQATSSSHHPSHSPNTLSHHTSYHQGTYDHANDSGIGIEDLEAEYDPDGASDRSGSVYGQGYGHQHSNSGGSGGSRGGVIGGWQQGHANRLPSMDMGIDAIINRPNGRR